MDRINSNLPRIKNALHGLQAFCILVAGIMTVVFLVKGKHSGGAIIFYLVLVCYSSSCLSFFWRGRRAAFLVLFKS